MEIKKLNESYKDYIGKEIEINGWVKNNRNSNNVGFIDFNDGIGFKGVQLVYSNELKDFDFISKIRVGSALNVKGKVCASQGKQDFEIQVISVNQEGDGGEDYPIQPKRHSREFLRENAYLRPRTNLFNAVFRVRSLAAAAVHEYFQKNGFIYFNAPIITASDAEGAGEMFQVTTLDLDKIKGEVDYSKDFFGKKAGLTVSGQLEAETFAMAFSKVYTFGPTFRAENSNTTTHLAEFWMIEPEMAFCDLNGDMDVMEDMLKYVINYVLSNAKDEMSFLDSFVEKGLIEKLTKLVNSEFVRITHAEVIDILQNKLGKENSTLMINFGVMALDKNGLTFGIIPKTAKIIITVPNGEKINCIDCESDYGDISVSDVEVKNIDITSNYGDLRFKNLKCDELETKQDFGDVKFDGSLIGNIDIESSYGDIDFDIDGDEDDYNMDITTKCGDVDINDEEYEKKNVVINNDGNNNITLDVSYGDVEINIR